MTIETETVATASAMPAPPEPVEVAYCVYREGLSSVFHSQVIVPLSGHAEDVKVRLAVHTPLGHLWRKSWRQRIEAVAETCQIHQLPVDWLPSPPTRLPWLFSDARQLVRWIRRHYQGRHLILHCRNVAMTDIALRAREQVPDVRIIYDCRGVEAAELEQQLRQRAGSASLTRQDHSRVKAAQVLEARCTRDADHVLCVSNAMREYLVDAHGISHQKTTVVPCCPDIGPFQAAGNRRQQVRQELGVEDQLVVTYCGSMAWYQLPDQALRIVRLLQRDNERIHFLAITTQPEQMNRELRHAEIPSDAATVLSVSPADVPRYLSAGDVGLLLRDETLVNRVASPVKFGEYLTAGLPVVISDHLGDYSQAVRDQELGLVVSLSESDESLQSRLWRLSESAELADARLRSRCQRFVDEHLTWSSHLPRISALYRTLME